MKSSALVVELNTIEADLVPFVILILGIFNNYTSFLLTIKSKLVLVG